jgi:hypothetical protein
LGPYISILYFEILFIIFSFFSIFFLLIGLIFRFVLLTHGG